MNSLHAKVNARVAVILLAEHSEKLGALMRTYMISAIAVLLGALVGLGCATTPRAAASGARLGEVTKAVDQQALTPDAALTLLRQGNQRFVTDA